MAQLTPAPARIIRETVPRKFPIRPLVSLVALIGGGVVLYYLISALVAEVRNFSSPKQALATPGLIGQPTPHCVEISYIPKSPMRQTILRCTGVTTTGEYIPFPYSLKQVWLVAERGDVWVYDCSKTYKNLKTDHIDASCAQVHIRAMKDTADVIMSIVAN